MVNSGAMLPGPQYEGRWLRSSSHDEWGLGFCTGFRRGKLALKYVDIPDAVEHVVTVDESDVIDDPIPKGTRVWVRGKRYGWQAAVVGAPGTWHRYHISLVGRTSERGRPQSLLLHQDQFKIRWSRPLDDPAIAVAHGFFEAPSYYEARSALLAELVEQRRVSRGITSAMAAPINLYQHQLDTAARVLSDPVMRYLLADEVGLGKTIEAGIVIAQVLAEDPATQVLVLCPDGLVGQWKSELKQRFGLKAALLSPRLVIAPYSSLGRIAAENPRGLQGFALVVVDEAHNLFRHLESGSELERQFRSLDGLLALSATPMRGQLETFRRLLALVDPLAFEGSSAESFEARIDERERSAGDVQVLSSRRASLRQKSSVLPGIEEDFSDDSSVRKLAEMCRQSSDPQDSVWSELANYVREIYRISRRMIRHRRGGDLAQSYDVAGRTPTFVEFVDPARQIIDEFLDSYRLRLGDQDVAYAMTVLHGLAGPTALRAHLQQRLHEDESSLFERTIARLELTGFEARPRTAAEVTRDFVHRGKRVVVASSFPEVIEQFGVVLSEYLDQGITFSHYHSMTPKQRDNAVADFLHQRKGSVLLADDSMEEGRNLQEAQVIVNLDLPLDANRLDQRIGRLDRYAVHPEPAEVVVLVEPDSEWVSAQVELLRDGIGVFDVSVSTVQRLLTAIMGDVIENLVSSGAAALRPGSALREQLEIERLSIDLLEELESIESASVFDDPTFDELMDYEADSSRLRRAFRRLTTGTGSIALRPIESSSGVITFGEADALGLSDEDAERVKPLLVPKAFERAVAVYSVGVSPLRVGDPLVNWLHDFILADERGRASAIARPLAGLEAPELWLRCEFLIEFDDDQQIIPNGPARARFRRRGESHLQPIKLETWTDVNGPAPVALVADSLELPYDPTRDEILRGPLIWGEILKALPNWRQLCEQSAEAAWEEVRASSVLEEACRAALERARSDSARRSAILAARSKKLPSGPEREAAREELHTEHDAAEALIAGISNPSIRLVACAACVLWPEDNF